MPAVTHADSMACVAAAATCAWLQERVPGNTQTCRSPACWTPGIALLKPHAALMHLASNAGMEYACRHCIAHLLPDVDHALRHARNHRHHAMRKLLQTRVGGAHRLVCEVA